MEKPIIDRWMERKMKKIGQQELYEYEIIDSEFNRSNYPDLIGKVYDDPPAYVQVEKHRKEKGGQETYANLLREKVDREATTFDEANWSNPGRRPGGIYRSARKVQPTRGQEMPKQKDEILPLDKFGQRKGLEKGVRVIVKPVAEGLIGSYPAAGWITKPTEVTLNEYAPNQGTLDVIDVILEDGTVANIYDFNIDKVVGKKEKPIKPLTQFGIKKEGKMDLNKVIVDLWDRGIIGDRKVEALQRSNKRIAVAELIRVAKVNGLGDVLKVLAGDGTVVTKDRHGYPDGDKGATDSGPSVGGKDERLPGDKEPAEKGVSPLGKDDRMPGVKEPAKQPWDGWKRKYEERENDIKDSKPGASVGGTDERLPGNKEGEHSPKGPYPGTHYGKKVNELNACIKVQDFNGIARVAQELEDMKKKGQQRTPYEISKDQRERDRKIEGAPHEPKISPSQQKSLGSPEGDIKKQVHTTDNAKTTGDLSETPYRMIDKGKPGDGELNPSPAIDDVKGTPDPLGNPESQIDLSKSLRGMFTGVERDTKEGQKVEEDFHLTNKGEPKFEWTTIPGEQDQEPRTIKTTPDLSEQKSTTVPGIGKGEDNQLPGKSALAINCKACKEDLVLSEEGYKEWIDMGKTICRCGNLIEAELDMKIDTDMFSGAPKVIEMESRDLTPRKKKAKKGQVNWVREAKAKGESVLDRFFSMKKKGQIVTDDASEVGALPDRKAEDEAHDYDKEYKKKLLEDTKPQKSNDKGEDHDYKGPIEDILKDSPKPLETQEDREKELKKGQQKKCKKCGKPVKENTEGDMNYCQGHSPFFDEPTNDQNDKKEGQLDMSVEGGDSTGGDCLYCQNVWDEDTRMEYGDSGEVECPHCGNLVSSFDKEGKKKDGPGRGSKTPKDVKEMAEKMKGHKDIEEPFGLATYQVERQKHPTKKQWPTYEEVKGRLSIFDNGGKSEDRYLVVTGTKVYTITNQGRETFIGDAKKFDLNHIVKSNKKVAIKDVSPRVQRAIFRRLVGIRRGQLSETDPMQMTTGKPTSEIEKIKPTRKPVDEPINVIMTPSLERSDGAGTPIDPTYLAEQIVRGLRYSHYHTAQEGFNHIIRATKDITKEQVGELKELMSQLGYDVSEQKGDIVKTG